MRLIRKAQIALLDDLIQLLVSPIINVDLIELNRCLRLFAWCRLEKRFIERKRLCAGEKLVCLVEDAFSLLVQVLVQIWQDAVLGDLHKLTGVFPQSPLLGVFSLGVRRGASSFHFYDSLNLALELMPSKLFFELSAYFIVHSLTYLLVFFLD